MTAAPTHTLIKSLQEAGVTCRALASWCRCENGHKDLCGQCWLGGPEVCATQVIEALVERIVTATQQTDEALQQRDYWQGLTSRMADKVMA